MSRMLHRRNGGRRIFRQAHMFRHDLATAVVSTLLHVLLDGRKFRLRLVETDCCVSSDVVHLCLMYTKKVEQLLFHTARAQRREHAGDVDDDSFHYRMTST